MGRKSIWKATYRQSCCFDAFGTGIDRFAPSWDEFNSLIQFPSSNGQQVVAVISRGKRARGKKRFLQTVFRSVTYILREVFDYGLFFLSCLRYLYRVYTGVNGTKEYYKGGIRWGGLGSVRLETARRSFTFYFWCSAGIPPFYSVPFCATVSVQRRTIFSIALRGPVALPRSPISWLFLLTSDPHSSLRASKRIHDGIEIPISVCFYSLWALTLPCKSNAKWKQRRGIIVGMKTVPEQSQRSMEVIEHQFDSIVLRRYTFNEFPLRKHFRNPVTKDLLFLLHIFIKYNFEYACIKVFSRVCKINEHVFLESFFKPTDNIARGSNQYFH